MRISGNKIVFIAVSFSAALLLLSMNDSIAQYVTSVKRNAGAVPAMASFDSQGDQGLYDRIVAEANNRKVAPVDAKVDRVWKAIPGYNGIEVDIEKTFRTAKASPNDPIRFFYREVAPKVNLEDLGRYPIYKGNPNKKMAALMINVAWGNEYLDPMLEVLEQERVKATFFFDGTWLKKNADTAKKIQSFGHELSNHAYSHPNMSTLGRTAAYQQIAKTESLLKETLGVKNRWFAPPSGDYNQMTVDVAAEQGLKTVLWTVDTVDWKKPSPEWIVRKISLQIEPGALVLMHPTASSSQALPGIIREIKRKGIVLGTVSETLSPDRVPPVS
ncbi:polysaccharide deacetylase family protein [Paenibacillus tarimensis]